jgi:hypothetical protein
MYMYIIYDVYEFYICMCGVGVSIGVLIGVPTGVSTCVSLKFNACVSW